MSIVRALIDITTPSYIMSTDSPLPSARPCLFMCRTVARYFIVRIKFKRLLQSLISMFRRVYSDNVCVQEQGKGEERTV